MPQFAVKIYEPNRKQILIKSKQTLPLIKELRQQFPVLKKLITHKGRANLFGEWETINVDIAQFSKKYPAVLFELRRVETAVVEVFDKENNVKKNEEKTLVTIIQCLNGSINIQTFSGKEEKENENEQQEI